MKEDHRQLGTISKAYEDDADGRFDTVWVSIRFEGSAQGFGGWVLSEHKAEWLAELYALFGVTSLDELAGKRCWALRSFPGLGAGIEGLENMDGRRFTATDFWRKHLKTPVENPLQKERASIHSTIRSCTTRIDREMQRLATLEENYVEWSSSPSSSYTGGGSDG